jgi:hypothetical protein
MKKGEFRMWMGLNGWRIAKKAKNRVKRLIGAATLQGKKSQKNDL